MTLWPTMTIKLPVSARLTIDANFLATRYCQHGRLWAIVSIDHRVDQQILMYINGIPVSSQDDGRICFHVNGYHLRKYVQQRHKWNNCTWDSIDFCTFGNHFERLSPHHRGQHFKSVHDQLPLGERRFQEAPVNDMSLKFCPCCKKWRMKCSTFPSMSIQSFFFVESRSHDSTVCWHSYRWHWPSTLSFGGWFLPLSTRGYSIFPVNIPAFLLFSTRLNPWRGARGPNPYWLR